MDHQPVTLASGVLVERYRIERALGSSAFTVSYVAIETESNRQVLLKEYLPSDIAGREIRGLGVNPLSAQDRELFQARLHRFCDGLRVATKLRHPAISTVLCWFLANGTAYEVVDYIEGETLREILERGFTLPQPGIDAMLRPLLDGVKFLHAAGVLHRDIQPANILIRRDTGQPVLLNAGDARPGLCGGDPINSIITPGYAPVELYVSDGNLGPWTDLYSIGAVLYRCVTGEPPPQAVDRLEMQARGGRDPMEHALVRSGRRYSRSLLCAIESALSLREEDRPHNVEAFLLMLDRE